MKTIILFLLFAEYIIEKTHSQCCVRFNALNCIECPDGTHLFQGNCLNDLPNCLNYRDGFWCAQCEIGFALREDNVTCEEIRSNETETPIIPSSGFIPVPFVEFRADPIIGMVELVQQLYEEQVFGAELFKAYSREQAENRIYRLIFSTQQGFLQVVIGQRNMSENRVFSQKFFKKTIEEEYIDLFSDPYFNSIKEEIKKNNPFLSTLEIVDGFRRSRVDSDSLIYRIFLLDPNSGLRELNVTISTEITEDLEKTVTQLDLETIDPLLQHVVETITAAETFNLKDSIISKFQKIVDSQQISYNVTLVNEKNQSSYINFEIDEQMGQIKIIDFKIFSEEEAEVEEKVEEQNCTIMLPTAKEPTNKLLTMIEYEEVLYNFTISAEVELAISKFRNEFYPETKFSTIKKLYRTENKSAEFYEYLYEKVDEQKYSMTFALSKSQCNRTLDLIDFYTYTKNDVKVITIPSKELAQMTLNEADPGYFGIFNFVSITNPKSFEGTLRELTVISINEEASKFKVFEFKYEFPELPQLVNSPQKDNQFITYRVKRSGSSSAKVIPSVKTERQSFVQFQMSESENEFIVAKIISEFFTPKNISNAKILRVLVNEKRNEVVRYEFAVGMEIVVIEINLSQKFQPREVARRPNVSPPNNNSQEKDSGQEGIGIISIQQIQTNQTLFKIIMFSEDLYRNEIEVDNLSFTNLERSRKNSTHEYFTIKYSNSKNSKELIIELLLELQNGEITMKKQIFNNDNENKGLEENKNMTSGDGSSEQKKIDQETFQNIPIEQERVQNSTIDEENKDQGLGVVVKNQSMDSNGRKNETASNQTMSSGESDNSLDMTETTDKEIVIQENPNVIDFYVKMTGDAIQSPAVSIAKSVDEIKIQNNETGITYVFYSNGTVAKIETQRIGLEKFDSDAEICRRAISQWLHLPKAKITNLNVEEKESYAGQITRYSVSFLNENEGVDIKNEVNYFVFEVETRFPGWNFIPMEARVQKKSQVGGALDFGEVKAPSKEAIMMGRILFGTQMTVKTERQSSDKSHKQIEIRHYSEGRIRITARFSESERKLISVKYLEKGYFRSAKSLTHLRDDEQSIIFKTQMEIIPQLINPKALNEYQIVIYREKTFKNQVSQIQLVFQSVLHSETFVVTLLVRQQGQKKPATHQIIVTEFQKETNFFAELSAKKEKEKQEIMFHITEQIEYKMSVEKLQQQYGYYIIGFQPFRVVLEERQSQRIYKIIYVKKSNNKRDSYISAIVAYDYEKERSRVLSISILFVNELENEVPSEVSGCTREKISGECVLCRIGYVLGSDENCYEKERGCSLQSGRICLECEPGYHAYHGKQNSFKINCT